MFETRRLTISDASSWEMTWQLLCEFRARQLRVVGCGSGFSP